MDNDILCASLKELYGENNDFGLFREDLTEAQKSNLLRNFDGGAAGFYWKGWIPYSGHDLFTRSFTAFTEIIGAMKNWENMTPEQRDMLMQFSERKRAENTDEARYVADMVMTRSNDFYQLWYNKSGGVAGFRGFSLSGRTYNAEQSMEGKAAFEEFKQKYEAEKANPAASSTSSANLSGEQAIHSLTSTGYAGTRGSFQEDTTEADDEQKDSVPIEQEGAETGNDGEKKPQQSKVSDEDLRLAVLAYQANQMNQEKKQEDKSADKDQDKDKDKEKDKDKDKDKNKPKTTTITAQPNGENTGVGDAQPQAGQNTPADANGVQELPAQGFVARNPEDDDKNKGWFERNWQVLTGALVAIAVAVGAYFLIRKEKNKAKKANAEATGLQSSVSQLQTQIGALSSEIAKNQNANKTGASKPDASQDSNTDKTPSQDNSGDIQDTTPPAADNSSDNDAGDSSANNSGLDNTLSQNCNCNCCCGNSSGSTLEDSSSSVSSEKDQIVIQVKPKEY